MMKERTGNGERRKTPISTAAVTFVAFALIGLIPLLSYLSAWIFDLNKTHLFLYSCLLTAIGLAIVGYFKSIVTEKNKLMSILETLILGGIAAGLSYVVGAVLERMFV